MSEEQQLRTVKKMINAGMYDEARAALLTIDHPLADKWLKKLDEISPASYQLADRNQEAIRKSQSTSRKQTKAKSKSKPIPVASYDDEKTSSASIVIIIVVMIGIGALLVGGAFMLAQSQFIEPAITTDNTGCGAQDWITAIDGSFNELYRYNLWEMLYFESAEGALKIDEDLRNQKIQDLQTRLVRIENTSAPACTEDVRDQLIEAYKSQIRATEILQPDNPLNAFGLFGKTLNLMKSSAIELTDLGAQFRRIDYAAIEQLVAPTCPAFEYVTRTMYVDNQFIVMLLVDPQVQSLDAYYSYIRDLAQQYYRVLDDPNVNPCLWEVRNQFVEMIDSYKSALEALSGNDLYGFEVHYERFNTALDQFYVELATVGIEPTQFGSEVVIREDS